MPEGRSLSRTHTLSHTLTHIVSLSLPLSLQVGWVMNDGLITFERVRDWEARECQRHICEIQGPVYLGAPIWGAGLASAPKLTDLHRKPNMPTYALTVPCY